jgi:hypothetical protein
MGQLLSAPRPRSIEEVVRGLGMIQMDPTSAVARTEHLVLWSRLGKRFHVADLERMLWQERSLFEYWAHILPTTDLAIYREVMRRRVRGDSARTTSSASGCGRTRRSAGTCSPSSAGADHFALASSRIERRRAGGRAAGTTTRRAPG